MKSNIYNSYGKQVSDYLGGSKWSDVGGLTAWGGKELFGLSEMFYFFIVIYQNSSNCTLKTGTFYCI